MKASEANLLDFLRKSNQFEIPIYQRTYSWTERECRQLWEDIQSAGRDEGVSAHFIGSIVYIEKGLSQVIHRSPLMVIDGQQRLTTVMLIIEVLARRVSNTEPVEGFSARKLRNRYLRDPDEDGEAAQKLLLTQTDKQTLLAIMDQKPLPADCSLRVRDNFEFFDKQIKKLNGHLEPLCRGLDKLTVVDIALNRDHDNPQLIFESMNSTGRALSQADLIRNFILMGLDRIQQIRLYENHWRPMEDAFGQESYNKYFNGFVRNYLTVRTGRIPKINEVYEAFKVYSNSLGTVKNCIDRLVADLHKFAGYYCAIALDQEPDKPLRSAFADLRELKVDVAYPFLLEIYEDYTDGLLTGQELEQAVRLVEAYVFRRAVCSIPTNSFNKTFATFSNALDKSQYLESIRAHFLLMQTYRRFPDDNEFYEEFVRRDLYNNSRRSYWLRRLENHERKERVPINEYTIEHIMPQNKSLSKEWRADLGSDWQRVHSELLHTPGNLTLTGYNTEYSDYPFAKKRDMDGGFRESPLRLNEGLRKLDRWNEPAIQRRAGRLAEKAIKVWVRPSLPQTILYGYRSKPLRRRGALTINDYRHLTARSHTRVLFDAFRKEVCALDPCVTEEFLKVYIAYKAETNFVDIEPQAQGLRLSLNLPFHELRDDRKLANDITNLGRRGNGDVEVKMTALSEMPYVIGLVRQALEKQMGD